MNSVPADFSTLKANMRAAWMAGDFGVIARYAEAAEKEFVERLALTSGVRLLDVACGTGNTAVPAAQAGANVTGVDIAPNLLAQARRRAEEAGVSIDFREGDAEQLDFADNSFDVVISVFGAMFAPRPERVASEFLRVCKPGGTIAMANWTPSGFVGKMFTMTSKHVPPPPGVPPPTRWGDETEVRHRFAAARAVECKKYSCDFVYPIPPAEVVELFRQYFGPTKVAFSRLNDVGQKTMASDFERLWTENNRANDGATNIPGEYLEVRVTK